MPLAVASYNAMGSDGRPAIVPTADPLLSYAAIQTIERFPAAAELTYRFPGLSGAGRQRFGLLPTLIEWQLDFTAVMADLVAFENKLLEYQRYGGRYRLVSEKGRTWDYCELRDWKPEQATPIRHNPLDAEITWFRRGVLSWEWMQP